MESWWLTPKLGHSSCLEQGQAGGMWGLGVALPGLGPGTPHRPRAGTPWSGGGACYVGAACLAECWV